jgi:3',5'-cyclic AMP phosphodiesterase CpdA
MDSNFSSLRRRDLLAAGPLGALAALHQGHAAVPSGEPVFRFLQINDLHFAGPLQGDRGYLQANRRIEWLFERVRSRDLFPAFDFMIVLGDFVHGGTLESIQEEMPVMHAKLNGLGVPYYTVTGNHENRQSEGDDQYEAPYRAAFGSGRAHYSFVHKGIEFLILNNSGSAGRRPPEVFAERARRLESMLAANPKVPKVLCCHIPLTPVREEPVLKSSFGFNSYKTMEPEILEMVQAKSSHVRAVLSGHLHLTGKVQSGKVHHVSISGTASYPHDIAMYAVFPDRIEAEVLRLPSDLLVPETNIHGARRHKRDFTDSLHPDYSSYLMGTPAERRWMIALS